jgi:rare lipoprotein A
MLRLNVSALLLALAVAIAGCSSDKPKTTSKLDPFAGKGSPYYKGSGKIPRGGGRYHVGKPYEVAGKWFTPREQPGYDKTGMASWYGEAFHRRMTSNGEYFDMNMLSAAHPTLPLPSYAKVTNLANGRSVVVRINDRGPFVGTRIIDMSKRSAEAIGFHKQGKAEVRVQYIGPAPLNDQGKHLAMMNERLKRNGSLRQLVATARGKTREIPVAEVEKPLQDNTLTAVSYTEPEEELAPASSFVVHVAEFNDDANAAAARDSLVNEGPGQIYEAGQGVYVLRLGPFQSEIMARKAHQAVLDAGFRGARLIRVRLTPTAQKL